MPTISANQSTATFGDIGVMPFASEAVNRGTRSASSAGNKPVKKK
jgi:hypothetical protein